MSNPAVIADFMIGTYAGGTGGMVTLASLNIPMPKPIYRTAVSAIKLGDNSMRELGSPMVEWQFGFITQAQRDTLRTYCTGVSAQVYIKTPTTEKISGVSNAAQTFLAQMIWPAPNTPESPEAGRRLQFNLLFKQLVAQ